MGMSTVAQTPSRMDSSMSGGETEHSLRQEVQDLKSMIEESDRLHEERVLKERQNAIWELSEEDSGADGLDSFLENVNKRDEQLKKSTGSARDLPPVRGM